MEITTTYEIIQFSTTFSKDLIIDIYGNNNTIIPEINIKNKTLCIETTASYTNPGDICNIIIYLPEKISFKNISILSENKNEKEFLIPDISAENIIIEKVTADIRGKSISGNLILKTVTGDIELNNITSNQIYLSSKKGNINIKSFEGEYVSIKTSNKITADDITCDFFDIKSEYGNISLALNKAPESSSYLKSDRGQLQLFIPKDESFDLSVYSSRGFFFDKKMKKRSSPRHEYTISYHKGGPVIHVATKSGNIELYDF